MIEGLESGKIAVFTKMHHSTVDGVSGANAISYMCSLEPDAPPLESAPERPSACATPGDAELFARGVVTNLTKPVAGRQAGRRRPPVSSPGRSAAPAAVRRWPRR